MGGASGGRAARREREKGKWLDFDIVFLGVGVGHGSGGQAADAYLGAIADLDEKVAAPAAWAGQSMAGQADDFVAGHAGWNDHFELTAIRARDHFLTAAGGAAGSNAQVASQVGPSGFKSWVWAQGEFDHDQAAVASVAGHLDLGFGGGVGRDDHGI